MNVQSPLLAVVAAVAISVVNTLIGYVVARKAFGKELNTFLSMVFGSFAVRAAIVIGLVWYLLSVAGVHQVWFSISFAISCFVALMAEIFFFHHSYETAKRKSVRPVTDLLKKKVGDVQMIFIRPYPYPAFAQ